MSFWEKLFGVNTSSSVEIHEAVLRGDLTKVKSLVMANPDMVFSKDRNGVTALHWAAHKGRKKLVKLLLDCKVDVNSADYRDDTPLHWAAYQGHKDVAEVLLANGADVNAKDRYGFTPLHWAAVKGRKSAAQLLQARGGVV